MLYLKIKPGKKTKRIVELTLLAIIIAGVIGGSYYLGFIKGQQQTRHILVEGVKNIDQNNTADFSVFWQAWDAIKSSYVSQQATSNNTDLVYGAISGLVNSLSDPYSVFFPPSDATKFTQEISGQFGGIGAEMGTDAQKQIVIVAPLKDTPAYKAGLKSGDRVLKIDGRSTTGMSVDEAVNLIRGLEGTTVTLTIARDEWAESKDIKITREIIQVPTLDFKMVDSSGNESASGHIAYIRIYNFYEQSPMLFYQTALKAIAAHAQGMIVDLRDDPGGYLDAAVSIGGWFVEKGKPIVTEEFRNSADNQVSYSNGPSVFKDMPVAVLINKGSASASEILAGALKDSDNATVIGETSFGKGTVQELIPLSDDSMLKLTIAHWLTPNGHLIDKNGITPDIAVTTPDNSSSTQSTYSNDLTGDVVFKKAIEVLDKQVSTQ